MWARGLLSLLSVIVFIQISCSRGEDQFKAPPVTVDIPVITKVTKEYYLKGSEFCRRYVNIDGAKSDVTNTKSDIKEYGRWIEVPRDYKNPSEKIKIYAYSARPFDASLPSYLFVDGGPGQNTHGFKGILDSGINEIKFDQRGIGCSAPETWEDYRDPSLYSTENTVRDMDEIRKAYDIDQWSIYGVSYGTMPATVYGHMFGRSVRSLVLEGVIGKIENFSRMGFQVEKFNLIRDGLNEAQKKSFSKLVNGDDGDDRKKSAIIGYVMGTAGYRDGGYRQVQSLLRDKLIKDNGDFDELEFEKLSQRVDSEKEKYNLPQFPGAVDENILTVFYCKELDGYSDGKFSIAYDEESGFYEYLANKESGFKKSCDEWGVTEEQLVGYDERNYSVAKPIYYFQGSHDGATMGDGALSHWKVVPKAKSYFMLSLKGGHNPALTKIRSADPSIKESHKILFKKAFLNEPVTQEFIQSTNSKIKGTSDPIEKKFNYITWELFTNNKASFEEIEKEFKGAKTTAVESVAFVDAVSYSIVPV